MSLLKSAFFENLDITLSLPANMHGEQLRAMLFNYLSCGAVHNLKLACRDSIFTDHDSFWNAEQITFCKLFSRARITVVIENLNSSIRKLIINSICCLRNFIPIFS